VSSSCSTSATRRVNLVIDPVFVMNKESTGKCLRQVEHIRGHLWHIYSIAVNQVMVANVKLHQYETLIQFSLNIFYLLKYAKRIRHKLNKLMKSSTTYNKLQHYLIEHACIWIVLTLICVNWRRTENEERNYRKRERGWWWWCEWLFIWSTT
jgi:hypothetical protein